MYLKMIEEIDKIEAECKKKSENLKGDYDLKSFETYFERLKSELDKLEISIANWDNIAVEANQQVIKLDELIKRLKNELLLDKAYSFLPIMQSLENEVKSAKIYTEVNKIHITIFKIFLLKFID